MRISPFLLFAVAGPLAAASTWSIVSAKGQPQPGKRWGHTTSTLPSSGDQLIFCGGADWDGDLVGACYLLNSSTFSMFMDAGTVSGRGDHCAVVFGNLLVLYGGNVTQPTDPTMPQAFRLDSRSYASDIEVSGDPPPARWGHTGVFIPGSASMLVFGGSTEDGFDQNDLVLLGLGDGLKPSFAWSPVVVAGSPPANRHYHAAVAYGAYEMIITGGTNSNGNVFTDTFVLSYNVNSGYAWYVLPAVRAVPHFGHAAVLVGNTLVVYGGSIPSSSSGGNVRLLDVSLKSPVWQDTNPVGSWLQTPFRANGALLDPSSADISSFKFMVYGGKTIDGFTRSPPSTLALLTQTNSASPSTFDWVPVIIGFVFAIVALISVAMFFVYRYGKARAASRDAEAEAGEGDSMIDDDDNEALADKLVVPIGGRDVSNIESSSLGGQSTPTSKPANRRNQYPFRDDDVDEPKIEFSPAWE